MVEEFIDTFKPAKDIFLNGRCYWFAVILQKRFRGRIVYDIAANHFATEIFGRCYDASGDVTDVYSFTDWNNYDDDIHKERIIRDCIL